MPIVSLTIYNLYVLVVDIWRLKFIMVIPVFEVSLFILPQTLTKDRSNVTTRGGG
jgi:hypothetical protein